MILLALLVAGATLAAGVLVALLARRLPSLRLQLGAVALAAAILPLVAVLATGALMFGAHNLTVLVVAAASALTALVGAGIIARSIIQPLDRLRTASAGIAAGELSARAPEHGAAEVRALARDFNAMGGRLEELFDARRQLVAWASHDLRTPLASLQAMIEAVEDGIATPEEYLPAMRDQVGTLGGLIDDLFELARLDAGALTFELQAAGVPGLVRSCLRGVAAEAQARHIHLEARIDDPVPPAHCAPDKVERVLYNLLRNALSHTPSDGSVAVVVRAAADEVHVEVEDTGEGLTPETVGRMFDHFWRGDRARTTEAGGSGLGLAIARGLIEAQGGRIWAEDRGGAGARVCFTLPAASGLQPVA